MLLAQQANIQPQVFPEARRGTLTGANMLLHAPGHHVPRGQLHLLGFIVGHESVLAAVEKQATVTPTALRDQYPRGEYPRGMKLHRLHVAQHGATRFQGNRGTHPLVDYRIGGHAVDAPESTGGNAGAAGDVGHQLPRDEIPGDDAVTPVTVADQCHGLHALVHRDGLGHGAVRHRIEHGMPRTVRHIACAPVRGTAEVARGDQAVGGRVFADADALTVDDRVVLAALHPVPGHSPGRKFANRLGRGLDKHAHHLLVRTPVAAAHRIGKMHIFIIAAPLRRIAQARLHAALGRCRVGTLRGHETQRDDLESAAPRPDGRAQTRETTADDEHIGVDRFHQCASSVAGT